MNAIQPFFFDGRQVRVTRDDQGEPWFVAKDACAVLGLQGPPAQHTRRLDDDEKGVIINHTPGGPQEMVTVSESGLYALIFTSRKPEARAFRKWVTGTVLPAIRRTGGYVAPEGGGRPAPSLTAADLSPSAQRLRPSMRAVALSCALQAAKMENGGLEHIRRYFVEFCEMVGGREEAAGADGGADDADVFREWMRRALVPDRDGKAKASVCYAAYRAYAEDKGVDYPWSQHRFGRAMGEYFPSYKSVGVIVYRGVRLAA